MKKDKVIECVACLGAQMKPSHGGKKGGKNIGFLEGSCEERKVERDGNWQRKNRRRPEWGGQRKRSKRRPWMGKKKGLGERFVYGAARRKPSRLAQRESMSS